MIRDRTAAHAFRTSGLLQHLFREIRQKQGTLKALQIYVSELVINAVKLIVRRVLRWDIDLKMIFKVQLEGCQCSPGPLLLDQFDRLFSDYGQTLKDLRH